MADLSLSDGAHDLVEAESVPTSSKSLWFQVSYGLANSVIGLGNITFYTLLLPARLRVIAPTAQTNTFLLLSGLGAVASIVTNPLVGTWSDRTTSLLGRRLPWLLGGMILLIVSMLTLAYAPSLLVLGVGAVLLQIAITMLLAALSAILPDQVPLQQRAMVSACGAMAPLAGGLVGQIVVSQVIKDDRLSFLVLSLLSVVLLLIFCLVLRDQPLPQGAASPFRVKDILTSFWIDLQRSPALARIWLARCCIFLASTTVVNYMYYFLTATRLFSGQQVVRGVQTFYTLYVVSLLVSSLACGKLSDVFQRRKVFVMSASVLMTLGVLLLAFFPTWTMVLAGTALLGLGFGAYLSTDLAMASEVLPDANRRGKDLGVINTAIFLPMLVAPLVAFVALTLFHSFLLLFLVLAVATLGAAGIILPMKGVR
jgi:MFS family permease